MAYVKTDPKQLLLTMLHNIIAWYAVRLHELFASSLEIVQIWNLKQECTAAMKGDVLSGISQVTWLHAQSCLCIQ